ncbi:bacteriorhodopsin [Haloplasma contractile]|uniref:Sensory rhodopsin-2 protein n=1 Tax=Haloplasma contractile SSD-17B TaxID=1033810 RepID=U2E6R7_9MOLU|nr:bacteriorhodopsin [Haloplasma contractile]ERJ10913.1 Sensory rhodopsin-2 protein [Haloplasma contractile SSD-17B]
MESLILLFHWIYSFFIFAGALYFYIQSRNPKGVPMYEYFIAIAIPVWSGIAYLSIAFGQGFLELQDQTVYFARYLDWIVTTPLLLIALALTAMFRSSKNLTLILTLVIADVIMILTGLIADFSDGINTYLWYFIGMVCLFVILYVIWYPLRRIAQQKSEALSKHYRNTALYLTLFWFCYPTVWLLGPSGLGITNEVFDVASFIILPIFSKVGFSILDLYGLRKIGVRI